MAFCYPVFFGLSQAVSFGGCSCSLRSSILSLKFAIRYAASINEIPLKIMIVREQMNIPRWLRAGKMNKRPVSSLKFATSVELTQLMHVRENISTR